MTTVPVGIGAYERQSAGVPEIVLLNRYAETAPGNLREHSLLLSRPGTTPQLSFSPGSFSTLGSMRGQYFFGGLFDDSLFVVCGSVLYRVHPNMVKTAIAGIVNGGGHPELAWQKGIGFERLFISDGLLLQFYAGTAAATGTLTLTGAIVNGVDQFQIGGIYYQWGTAFTPADDGTAAHPFIVAPLTDALGQLVKAIIASGVPGVDYSATLSAPNTFVTAVENGGPPGTSVSFTALSTGAAGNTISTTVTGGAALAFGAATLTGGGVDALLGVEVPDGQAVSSLTQVSGYVLVSIAGTQKFYWINPGEITIDPLNFAEKESSPDAIVAMRTTGDQAIIMGEASTENWYATGDFAAPFLPIEGRVYQHGAIDGTPCLVADSIMLVGDDGVAYQIDAGVQRISNHGIEERIRRQLARQRVAALTDTGLITPGLIPLQTPGGVLLESPS